MALTNAAGGQSARADGVGELPSERPVTYGTGAEALGSRSARQRRPPDACLICAEPEPTVSYVWTGGRMASLHAACDALWKQEQSSSD
jgi:hypothetical protein